jgi:hypothetical protein
MFEEIHFHHPELALLKLNTQLVFSQPLEHLSKMLHMLLHIVDIDQNVVYVYDHKIIKPFPENVIHECVKCGRCIGESKRHHQEFVRVIPCVRSSLFFIPFHISNLVISQT